MDASKTETSLKILLAVDESSYIDAAVDLLTHIQWPQGTSTYVLPIMTGEVGPQPVTYHRQQPVITATQPWHRTSVHPLTAEGGSRIHPSHLIADAKIYAGQSISMVLERAETVAADLIIIGMKEQAGGPMAFRLNATATNILHYAPQSVLVARPQEHIRPLRTILAVDGSPQTERVLEFACQLSLPNWATITVVTVAEEDDPAATEATASARAIVERLHHCGVQGRINILHGPAADQILAAAQTQQASLIVMGAHSRSSPTHLGGVARQVAQAASCSVLVVR